MPAVKENFRALFEKRFRNQSKTQSNETPNSSVSSAKQSTQLNSSQSTVNLTKRALRQANREHGSSSSRNAKKSTDTEFEKFPKLLSLAAARKQVRKVHQNTSREYYEDSSRVQSEFNINSNQSSRRESYLLNNDSLFSDYGTRIDSVPSFRVPKANTMNEALPSRSRSRSKDLPQIKAGLSKSSVLEEKASRVAGRTEQKVSNKAHEQKPKILLGSSENPSDQPLRRMISRSEAYLSKNRQDLEKALNNIKFKESNGNYNTCLFH